MGRGDLYLLFPQEHLRKKRELFQSPWGGQLAVERSLGEQRCVTGWGPRHQVYPEKTLEMQLKH